MTVSDEIGLVWFRRDLRIDDNPAWAAATAQRQYVVPLYVIDPRLMASVGPYRRRQLIASLQALDYELAERLGGRLLVRTGRPEDLVPEAVDVFQVGGVYFNDDVSPFARRRDAGSGTPRGPGAVVLRQPHPAAWQRDHEEGTVSRVFTPFFKTWQQTPWDEWPTPGDGPTVLDDPGEFVPRLDDRPPFFEGPGEARLRLAAFLDKVDDYDDERDRIDHAGTSQLSVDLRFGTISAREVATTVGDSTEGRRAFVRQLAWRDWYAHLLDVEPTMVDAPLNPKFTRLEWLDSPADISAWKGGFTGYPIVDAAMRQLRQEGWIHNRLRMVVGSFLCKDLLVDWRIGERHFRHLLVDFEPSQNVGNWQWVAGCGADASPFVRVFNPVTQSRKFDPTGAYLRQWVPELAALGPDAIRAVGGIGRGARCRRHRAGSGLPATRRRPWRGAERALIAYKSVDAPDDGASALDDGASAPDVSDGPEAEADDDPVADGELDAD
ncbi:MAG: deoxyribodipyrimidine photo-lyase [Acidimicrobiales bacterium]